MSWASPLLRKIHPTFPTNLVNISPFPGRCVYRRGRFDNVNAAVVRNGNVDPDYVEQDASFLPGKQNVCLDYTSS